MLFPLLLWQPRMTAETRELAAYGQIVNQARTHSGEGWLLYDMQFHQQWVARALMPWAKLNPSRMAATVLSTPGSSHRVSCSICLAIDHPKEE